MLRQNEKYLKTPLGMIITVLVLFFLQGCTTPLVNVDVKVGKCAPGETIPDNEIGLCNAVNLTSPTSFTNAMGVPVTCASGTKKCQVEGTTVGCRSGKCTTVEQTLNQCVCKCQP